MIVMIFMAVTSSGASEMLAVSSLFTFDIYRRYIKPKVRTNLIAALLSGDMYDIMLSRKRASESFKIAPHYVRSCATGTLPQYVILHTCTGIHFSHSELCSGRERCGCKCRQTVTMYPSAGPLEPDTLSNATAGKWSSPGDGV